MVKAVPGSENLVMTDLAPGSTALRMTARARVLLLPAVAALVYANTLLNGFTYDDEGYILRSTAVQTGSIVKLFQPTQGYHVFRPFAFSTFALHWAISGAKPFSYHLLNLLLHAAVTLLLFLLLRALLAPLSRGETIAFVAALLFAVHPIHTEAVASIVGRSELLAAGFLLAAWLLHLYDRPVPMLVCFSLALLSKESAAVFIALVLAGDYTLQKFKPLSRYASICGLTVLSLALLWNLQGGYFKEGTFSVVDNPLAGLPASWRILNALRIAWKYVGLHVYPATLSYDYSYNAITLYAGWTRLLPVAAATLLVLCLWIWAILKKRTPWIIAGAIYLAGFAVTSNILVSTGTIMGERLAYLPSAGFCLLVAVLWALLEKRESLAAWVLLLCILTTLSVRTVFRNQDWHDNLTLYSHDILVVPHSVPAHLNLGDEYLRRGRVGAAHDEYETALNIYPDSEGALERNGMVESLMGNDQEACLELGKALALAQKEDPNYDIMAWNLATVLSKIGHDDGALRVLDQEIAESRGSARVWSSRAVIRYRRGEFASARADAQAALQLDRGNAQAQNLLMELNKTAVAPVP
jgi:protein O-mannosyl-transferase